MKGPLNFSLSSEDRGTQGTAECPSPLRGVWFGKTPWWAGTALLAGLTVLNALLGLIANKPARVTLSALLTGAVLIIVYVPFVRVLRAVTERKAKCITVLRARYLVYVFFALQLAQANAYFTVFLSDEQAFAGPLCGLPPPATCTHENAFLVMYRLVYFSSVTFVSVGYGDIAPATPSATLAVFPQLWAPVFYLGLLLGKIAAEPQ